MKHTLVLAALGLVGAGVAAQEVGQVISSTPVVQQVAVPRQVCSQQPMVVQNQPSGAGGIIGALAGAALGSQIGGGSGRGVGAVVGTVGGALLGNTIESNNSQYVQNVPQCTTQTSYENRTVAWDVTYEYGGRRHTVQMPYDPGQTIRLQVTPVGGSDYGQPQARVADGGYGGPVVVAPPVEPQAQAQQARPYYPQPAQVYTQPAPVAVPVAPAPIVYQQYPAYPAYPAYPVYPAYRAYPPIGISLGFGFGGHRHRW